MRGWGAVLRYAGSTLVLVLVGTALACSEGTAPDTDPPVDSPPVASIDRPGEGTTFRAGDVIVFIRRSHRRRRRAGPRGAPDLVDRSPPRRPHPPVRDRHGGGRLRHCRDPDPRRDGRRHLVPDLPGGHRSSERLGHRVPRDLSGEVDPHLPDRATGPPDHPRWDAEGDADLGPGGRRPRARHRRGHAPDARRPELRVRCVDPRRRREPNRGDADDRLHLRRYVRVDGDESVSDGHPDVPGVRHDGDGRYGGHGDRRCERCGRCRRAGRLLGGRDARGLRRCRPLLRPVDAERRRCLPAHGKGHGRRGRRGAVRHGPGHRRVGRRRRRDPAHDRADRTCRSGHWAHRRRRPPRDGQRRCRGRGRTVPGRRRGRGGGGHERAVRGRAPLHQRLCLGCARGAGPCPRCGWKSIGMVVGHRHVRRERSAPAGVRHESVRRQSLPDWERTSPSRRTDGSSWR
jgi:hypothetical protein